MIIPPEYYELLAQSMTVSDQPLVRERYMQMRFRGESHETAKILAQVPREIRID